MLDGNETVYSSDIFSKLRYEDVKKAHMKHCTCYRKRFPE